MGMAASQARYLELTARKTDVEYQGQQINQQRTALSDESAGLFSQLMGLSVPTAPSSSDYTTTSYTFSDGATTNTISSITSLNGDAEYNANVSYYYTSSDYTGVSKTRSDLTATKVTTTTTTNGTAATATTYWLGTTKLSAAVYSATTTSSSDDTTALAQIAANCSSTDVAKIYNGSTTGTIYTYTSNGVSYYVSSNELNTMIANGGTGTLTTTYAADIDTKHYSTTKAYLSTESSGRYSSIELANTSGTYDLTASTTTDANAYNDAMNEYTYQEALYEQQVNSINAKTEVIENEDKTLELQLTQLDTEQQALSTELDSVKKVIDKNIEQTFKTFSGS